MASSTDWIATASCNLQAALSLAKAAQWRSACSRAYYASHNAAHAVLSHLDPAVTAATRSIPHGELPTRLWRAIKKSAIVRDGHADLLRKRLTEAYNIRVQADYKPLDSVNEDEFGDVRASARELVRLAEGLTQ